MIKVVGYGRVSTIDQALKGTSSEEQRSIIENECVSKQYELVQFYSDDGYSGKNQERPGLNQLLADSKEGKFELLLFTKLDRLGRNIRDIKNILHELEGRSINFNCIQQPDINKKDGIGNLSLNILSSFAEFERDMIKERTSNGRMLRWRRGQSVIGSLPLGYKKENGHVIIDENQRPIYERIVTLYIDEHYSIRDIALKLKNEGIPSHSGRSQNWYPTTIGDILKNEAYTGIKYQNKYAFASRQSRRGKQYFAASKDKKTESEWIEIQYPPLISKERFSQIRARIELQKRKPKKHHVGYENKFIAENVLFCGHCGSKLKKRHNQKENFHYCCYWWETSFKERESYGHEKCILGYVNADQIDEEIFHEIVTILSDPSKFAQAWYKDENIEDLRVRVQNLKTREKDLKDKLIRGFKYIKDISTPDIKGIYEEELAKDETDYQVIKKHLYDAEAELGFINNKVDRLAEFKRAFETTGSQKKMDVSTIRKIMAVSSSAEGSFQDFLYALSFQEKKRIIEAIISPETGGKCLVRYATPFDYVDDIRGIPNEELFELQKRDVLSLN